MSVREEYDSLIARYVAAVRNGDANAVADLFAEDAIVLDPGQPAIMGRSAIFALYRDWLDGGVSVTVNIQNFQDQGEVVYGTGTFQSESGSGNWLQVLQRQSDGTLLIHRLCSNQS